MKQSYPRWPERFAARQKRLEAGHPFLYRIAPILNLECEMVVESYYGGGVRAGLHLIRKSVVNWVWGVYLGVLMSVSDGIGWTLLRPVSPDSPDFRMRHHGKCDKFNCQSMDCHERLWPKWFQRLVNIRSGS